MQLIHGDAIKEMKKLSAGSIDLTVTSPPYDNLRTYKNTLDWNESIWRECLTELYRLTKEGGVVVWVVGDATIKGSETGTSFRQALHAMDCGFKLHDTMIYEKNSSSFPARKKGNRYTQIFEYMFVFSKGTPSCTLLCDKKNKWAGHTNWGNNTQYDKDGKLKKTGNIKPVPKFSPRNNIWKYSVGFNKVKGHPAVFPEKLAEDHILTWSKKNDTVLDPFMGSGTVGRMALRHCRDFIGIELVEEYFNLSKDTISSAL